MRQGSDNFSPAVTLAMAAAGVVSVTLLPWAMATGSDEMRFAPAAELTVAACDCGSVFALLGNSSSIRKIFL